MRELVLTDAEIKYISDYILEEQERYSEERKTDYFDMELIISNAIDAINGGALDQ
jgi:hypothetical protein